MSFLSLRSAIYSNLFSQSQECVPELVNRLNLDAVVTDFSPLRVPLSWLTNVKKKLPDGIPFCQVLLFLSEKNSCIFLNESIIIIIFFCYR
jgi:hypothetical protein